MSDDTLSVAVAAAVLGISPTFIHRNAHRLPVVRAEQFCPIRIARADLPVWAKAAAAVGRVETAVAR